MAESPIEGLEHVAYTTIRNIFRDPYTEVTLTTLGRLARTLEVETKDLIEDVPDK